MEFLPMSAVSEPEKVWEKLNSEGQVVITNNGKPYVLMIKLDEDFEEVIASIGQARAMRALKQMRAIAAKNDLMSEEEIEAEIQAARAEMRAREGS